MKVEHEIIFGRPTNLKPMFLSDVRQLKAGDKVYIWWAKDSNMLDVRVDDVCTILEISPLSIRGKGGIYLSVKDGDIDLWDEDVANHPTANKTDWGGRGPVYFYYPPTE